MKSIKETSRDCRKKYSNKENSSFKVHIVNNEGRVIKTLKELDYTHINDIKAKIAKELNIKN